MSAGKKAKANFEKTAKKKPDPAGLAIGKEAQAALVQKDYSKAKRYHCHSSDALRASGKNSIRLLARAVVSFLGSISAASMETDS